MMINQTEFITLAYNTIDFSSIIELLENMDIKKEPSISILDGIKKNKFVKINMKSSNVKKMKNFNRRRV